MRKCTYCSKEYPDEMNECPQDGQPLTRRPGSPPPLPSSVRAEGSAEHEGLGTTSLILGILSLFCGPFLGIPAIICGHIAVNRSRGQNGKAVAGLVTGYVGILLSGLAIMAGLLLPALAKAKQKAVQINCANNLRQVALAAKVWAGENNDTLPRNFLQMSNELAYPDILICPADPNHHVPAPGKPHVWDPNNISYEFVTPGISLSNADTVVIIRCPIHGTEVYGDGSVHMVRQNRQLSP